MPDLQSLILDTLPHLNGENTSKQKKVIGFLHFQIFLKKSKGVRRESNVAKDILVLTLVIDDQ